MGEWIKEGNLLTRREDEEGLFFTIDEAACAPRYKGPKGFQITIYAEGQDVLHPRPHPSVEECQATVEAFLTTYRSLPEEQPISEAPRVTDDMVERATMKLLAHAKDHAPGIDWHCNRQWTVNKVRALMRAALEEVV